MDDERNRPSPSMSKPPTLRVCEFCGLTADEVSLISRSEHAGRVCYDCVTFLAFVAATAPAPRTMPDGLFATNRPSFSAFLREWDSSSGTSDGPASTAQSEPPNPPSVDSCSFCGKLARQVTKMVAGPNVFICNECIAFCNDIISQENAPT